MKKILELFKQDVWCNNAVFVQVLGLCPTLAVTSTAVNALGLSIATTLVLLISNVVISLVRKIILPEIRIPIYVLLIASLVTCVQILMEAFMYSLYESLGIFIALIVTNCIIIGRAEAFAVRNNVFLSFLDGLFVGLGYTLVLVLIGIVREIIGFGTIFKGLDQLFGPSFANSYITVLSEKYTFIIAILPPGAFITLGLIIAGKNWLDNIFKNYSMDKNDENFLQ